MFIKQLWWQKYLLRQEIVVYGNTAVEVINNKVDNNKENIGLINSKGDRPTNDEIEIRRRYKKLFKINWLWYLIM